MLRRPVTDPAHPWTSRRCSALVAALASRESVWRPFVRFDASERYYTRVSASAEHEAWLLTWLPGQHTDLHDHGGSSGAFVVLEGGLREVTAGRRNDVVRDLTVGRVRAFGAEHIHQVANVGPVPAVSLHIYAPGLRIMRRYERDGNGLRRVSLEKAGADW